MYRKEATPVELPLPLKYLVPSPDKEVFFGDAVVYESRSSVSSAGASSRL